MGFPFGKFKGFELADIDSSYLEWLLDNIELRQPLLRMVQGELASRAQRGARPRTVPTAVDRDLVGKIIEKGFRQVALSAHPDTGGDNGAMLKLNNAADWLRSRARELS